MLDDTAVDRIDADLETLAIEGANRKERKPAGTSQPAPVHS